MADLPQPEGVPFFRGAIFPVKIEESLPDVLVVCLEHESRVFRGVLMDSNKRDMPYGLSFERFACEAQAKSGTDEASAVLVPSTDKDGNPIKAEVSALSYRHTFCQDPNSTDPRLLPPAPKRPKTFTKPLRDKNVRSNMRLRPRQILCSKCKKGIHDTKVEGNTTSMADDEQGSVGKLDPMDNTNSSATGSWDDDNKPKHQQVPIFNSPKHDMIQKLATPIIKISFNSTKGEGTVVKIPRKTHPRSELGLGNTNIKTKPYDDASKRYSYDEYKRLKKALKKARLRERAKIEQEEDYSMRHHHKKSKRNKHKKKHRHKTDSDSECVTPAEPPVYHVASSIDQEQMHSQSQTVDQHLDKDPEEKAEHALTPPQFMQDDVLDNSTGSYKENSLDPASYQAKMSRTFPVITLTKAEQMFESARMSTSSGNSDRSSVYDENSNSDFNDGPSEAVVPEDDQPELKNPQVKIRPLMMRIQTKNVLKCIIPDGRTVTTGDVVWGKIHGFPWWPGKIMSLTISQRDNGTIITQTANVAWFGSSTISHLPVAEVFPFLEDFKLRYNKKKRGAYKVAIKQATYIAHTMNQEISVEDLELEFED